MVTRVSYPVEIKKKAIEMRLAGIPVREVMNELGIRNKTQLKTWLRWYRNGELYRLEQPVGKQYSYGKGPEMYLSSILDLYNGEVVAYSIGDKQDVHFVLDTLEQLPDLRGAILHSDQGFRIHLVCVPEGGKGKGHYHEHVPQGNAR